MINKAREESSLQALLSQPFHPPPMFYERKAKPMPEKVIIMKAKKGAPQEALRVQEERMRQQMEVKEQVILQQKDMLIRQNYIIQ